MVNTPVGASLQMDNPFWEGRDAQRSSVGCELRPIRAWNQIAMESTAIHSGMVGPSHGGAIQLRPPGTPDKRIDAIIPTITFNSLLESLYPNEASRTAWGSNAVGHTSAERRAFQTRNSVGPC